MTSPFTTCIPTWLVQPIALANIITNQFSSLKELSTLVNVSDFHSFSSGLKQALYWKRQLATSVSDKTAIFSLLSDKGLIQPNVFEVCQALKSVCDMTQVVEFYRASNSSFIGISFRNSQEASKVRTLFSYYQNSIVIHALPVSSLMHQFKLLWLPPLFPDSRIHHFLSKHSVQHHFVRDLVSTDPNIRLPSNSVSGSLELSPSYNIEKIPHLIPLPSPYKGSALLILSGRPQLCLKCGSTGHVRRFCTAPRCKVCHQFHSVHSSCPHPTDTQNTMSAYSWAEVVQDLSVDPLDLDASCASTSECNNTLYVSSPNMITSDSIAQPSPSFSKVTASFISEHDQTSLPTALVTSITQDSAVPPASSSIVKRITRSMTSAKCPLSYSSQVSLTSEDIKLTNTYHNLPDEINCSESVLMATPPSLQRSHSTGNLSTATASKEHDNLPSVSVHTALATNIVSLPIQTQVFNTPDTNLRADKKTSPSSLLSHKRAKLSASELSPPLPSPSDTTSLSPSPSWAEQAEMELDRQDVLAMSPTCAPTSKSPLATSSISSPESPPCSISTQSPSACSSASSSSSKTLAYFESIAASTQKFIVSSDPTFNACLMGFPINTRRSQAFAFLDPIMPTCLYHIKDTNGDFAGNFGASFSSCEDADLAIAKNGLPYHKAIISVGHFGTPRFK